MKTIIKSTALATLAISCALAVSVANAQGAPTTEQLHARAFGKAGPKLELRDDGLVYKKGARKPYTGVIDKDESEEMRYVDGVLERIALDRRSGRALRRDIYLDGHEVVRRITFGENNAPTSDQILIDDYPFEFLILRKNYGPSGTTMPDTATLQIGESGLVSAYWWDNGQMRSGLQYVKGKCCLATGWHRNGQKSYEQKYVDGIGEGVPRVWDADGNDSLKNAEPVVAFELIQHRDDLDYLGYSTEMYTGKIVSIPGLGISRSRFEYSVANGIKHGTETRWYREDQIRSLEEWSNGVRLSQVLWHATGEKDREFIYVADPRFIEKLEMTDSSDPVATREYLVSQVKGYVSYVTSWHRNGQKHSESMLVKTGRNKSAEHGLVIQWDDNGRKISEAIYKRGIVKSKTMWWADGQKRCEVFRIPNTKELQYRGWGAQGNELEPTTFAEASREPVSRSGYTYACNVQKKQIGYRVKIVQ